jgi:hypothetical protein
MWQEALDRHPWALESLTRHVAHNVVAVLWAPSWPEVWPEAWRNNNRKKSLEEHINEWWRLIWAPLILLVVLKARSFRGNESQQAFILLTLCTLFLMMIQTASLFEGRYRKPVEPMVIISAALLAGTRDKRNLKEA